MQRKWFYLIMLFFLGMSMAIFFGIRWVRIEKEAHETRWRHDLQAVQTSLDIIEKSGSLFHKSYIPDFRARCSVALNSVSNRVRSSVELICVMRGGMHDPSTTFYILTKNKGYKSVVPTYQVGTLCSLPVYPIPVQSCLKTVDAFRRSFENQDPSVSIFSPVVFDGPSYFCTVRLSDGRYFSRVFTSLCIDLVDLWNALQSIPDKNLPKTKK